MADPHPTRELPSLAGAEWLTRADTRAVFDALAAKGYAARVGSREPVGPGKVRQLGGRLRIGHSAATT